MQSASRALRRSYATHIRVHRARELSAPLAVRERRAARGLDKPRADDMTPSEFAAYQRALALGSLSGQGKDGGEPTEKEWLAKLNERRNRIRGIRIEKQQDGQKKVVAVGQKIYLPNIIFRMVRNYAPPGKPYNPYEATFRIPQSVTKTDIRSYLLSVYGVETTYIRTDNYLSPVYRARNGSWTRTKAYKTYKRAVVGLVEPFEPPPALEDLKTAEQRKGKQEYLEKSFGIQSLKTMRKMAYLRMTKKGSDKWKWRNLTTKRSQILKAIGEARWRRENTLVATNMLMDEAREEGRPVDEIDYGRLQKLAAEEMENAQDYRDRERMRRIESMKGRRI